MRERVAARRIELAGDVDAARYAQAFRSVTIFCERRTWGRLSMLRRQEFQDSAQRMGRKAPLIESARVRFRSVSTSLLLRSGRMTLRPVGVPSIRSIA
jgi:hypothetical protein